MKASHLVAIASAVAFMAPVAGFAQTPSRPESSSQTTQRSTAPPMTDAAADRHTVSGEVTKVDADKGWVDVKTPDGRMKLHFPPPSLANVKAGDRMTVEIGIDKTAAATTR